MPGNFCLHKWFGEWVRVTYDRASVFSKRVFRREGKQQTATIPRRLQRRLFIARDNVRGYHFLASVQQWQYHSGWLSSLYPTWRQIKAELLFWDAITPNCGHGTAHRSPESDENRGNDNGLNKYLKAARSVQLVEFCLVTQKKMACLANPRSRTMLFLFTSILFAPFFFCIWGWCLHPRGQKAAQTTCFWPSSHSVLGNCANT